jgi:hypothetical protein
MPKGERCIVKAPLEDSTTDLIFAEVNLARSTSVHPVTDKPYPVCSKRRITE